MGSLDLAVELRRARFNINMSDSLVFNMPVEVSLPFMASIRPDCVNAERKLLDDVVDEINGTLLVVLLVDLKRTDPSGVIDGRVLIAPDLFRMVLQ